MGKNLTHPLKVLALNQKHPLLALDWYVLNSSMSTHLRPNIWFGTHLPEVTGIYQYQLHLIQVLMIGGTILVLATIIPFMITS